MTSFGVGILKNILTRVAVGNVKCHPKFNVVEGDLSQGVFVVHPSVTDAAVEESQQLPQLVHDKTPLRSGRPVHGARKGPLQIFSKAW